MISPEIIVLSSFMLTTLGVTVKIYQDNRKKVSYVSFDRYKKETEEKVQSKEICNIMYQQVANDIKEIKSDVKLLLRNGHK